VELKRQLAIREQDLTYAKQRNEKLSNEIETMKRELQNTSIKGPSLEPNASSIE